jgi:hypothetical protein
MFQEYLIFKKGLESKMISYRSLKIVIAHQERIQNQIPQNMTTLLINKTSKEENIIKKFYFLFFKFGFLIIQKK